MSRLRTWLGQFARGGTASVVANVGATNILRIVSTITLSRLLDADAYGIVGILTSVAFMMSMLTDVGMLQFIVRHPEADEAKFLDEMWTLRLTRGIVLTIAMIVFASPIAHFLGKTELTGVLALWGFSFLLDGMASLSFATGVRHQQLWRLSMMDLAGTVASFVVSLAIAAVTHSHWSLVIGMTVGMAVHRSLSYLLFPQSKRRWRFSRARSIELWGFSRYIALSSVLSLLILQTDKVVLARLMPLHTYGLYAIAVTLAAVPEALAHPYASRVLYGVYSKAALIDASALRHTFYAARRKVVLLYMFGAAGMIGAAPVIVGILYDERYRGVATYLQLLAISAVLLLPSLAANQALLALGHTRSTLVANISRITWLAIGGTIGLMTHNILLLVAIVGTVELPGMLTFWWNLRRVGLLRLHEEFYGVAAAAAGLALGTLGSTGMIYLFPSLG